MSREMNSEYACFGAIPSNWDVKKIKSVFTLKSVKSGGVGELLSVYLDRGVISYSDSTGMQVHKPSQDLSNYQVVNNGDFVLNNQQAWRGSVGVSKYDGIISPAYVIYTMGKDCDPSYMGYLLRDKSMVQQYELSSRGVGTIQRNIFVPWLRESFVLIPPLSEQHRIADFLDSKCSQIDEISKKIQEEIDTLEEYKKSVITEAVTKGLDANVEMKDSRNYWYGKIPSAWAIMKTLYVLSQPITDGPHTTPELFDDGVPFVSAEAVSFGKGGIDFDHIRGYISEEFYELCCKKYIPQKNDVYMIKSGATTGRVSIVTTDRKFTIWSPLAVFRCSTTVIKPKFLFYALQAVPYQNQVQDGWSFGTQQNIGMRTLEQLRIAVPPVSEQALIVEYLDKYWDKITEAIKAKQHQLSTLEEYKKSLIYEYVTGKKEVPDADA